ncbi:hypothetical protein L2E82_28290 [Cichorium intybus]|uniref:Uncharacterized protein n=1 Tax=Cichorium intybus TaxID=13427 RepID=A0ACB9CW02_CICIN|nr:hypothetical protein L2E82_28290 [Cichorium intybus]
MLPPFTRLASCCTLVKCCRNLRWISARSLANATCSLVSDSSSDTNHHTVEKHGRKFKDWGLNARSDNLLNDVIDNTNWEVVRFGISDDLFEALMEENLIEAIDVLVEVYISVGRFEEAIHTLSEMKSRGGLVVSTHTCNLVLYKLIECGKVDMVESVYRQLKSNGSIPNVFTYGMLIRGHCRNGCLKEAWDVFEQMEEAGVEPDAFTYGVYIHGLCCNGKTDLAWQVVKNLRKSNKPVDVRAYARVILGFVKESRLQDAEDVFLDMKLREVVPDAFCYGLLIRRYCLNGDIDKALDLCKEMESRGIKTNHKFVRSMVRDLCRLGMLDEALCVFKHLMQQSGVFLDGSSFNIVIRAACKLEKMDDAMGLLEEMKCRKIKPLVMQTLDSEPTVQTPDDLSDQNDHFDQKTLAGVEDQCVQPNVGQHEGADGVPLVQDARDQGIQGFRLGVLVRWNMSS